MIFTLKSISRNALRILSFRWKQRLKKSILRIGGIDKFTNACSNCEINVIRTTMIKRNDSSFPCRFANLSICIYGCHISVAPRVIILITSFCILIFKKMKILFDKNSLIPNRDYSMKYVKISFMRMKDKFFFVHFFFVDGPIA